MTATIEIELFTDPACPFAFSAEPVRRRLRWLYGDALSWRPRMIGARAAPTRGGREARRGGTRVAAALDGMPISPEPYARLFLPRRPPAVRWWPPAAAPQPPPRRCCGRCACARWPAGCSMIPR